MITQKKTLLSFIVLLAAAMLGAVVLIVSALPERPLMERIVFQDRITGVQLRPSYDETSDKYILFLPAYGQVENIRVNLPGALVQVSHGEQAAAWGGLQGMPLDQALTITARSLRGKETETLEIQHCGGLPSLFIQAEADALAYLHADKNHEKQALVLLRDEAGELVFSQVATLTGRGNSSWDGRAKRPYEMQFDSPVTFGPFAGDSRLCLLAEYADESKLHNAVAYYGAREMDIPYASSYYHVNVYFDGEYLGLYGIATKEEYRKHITTDGIQAVFEITSNYEKQDFQPILTRNPVRVIYGNAEKAASIVDGFEAALMEGDWERCREIIDPASFARKVVMEELFANSDMTYASQYFYLDDSGKLPCMLPWDYDLALGYAFRYYNNKQVWEMESYKEPNGWYAMLIDLPQFRQQVLAELETVCTPDFAAGLERFLMETAGKIQVSWDCDRLRWRSAPAFNRYDLSCGEETLDGMAALYADYFSQRMEFLKDHFRNWDDYCLVAFDGEQYGNLCIPKGSNLWDYLEGANLLQGEKIDAGFTGWFTAAGQTPEDISVVTEDLIFVASYAQT